MVSEREGRVRATLRLRTRAMGRVGLPSMEKQEVRETVVQVETPGPPVGRVGFAMPVMVPAGQGSTGMRAWGRGECAGDS